MFAEMIWKDDARGPHLPSFFISYPHTHATAYCVGQQNTSLSPLLSALLHTQVHTAVLAGSGKEVVVKVLRPGTEDVLITDLNFVSNSRALAYVERYKFDLTVLSHVIIMGRGVYLLCLMLGYGAGWLPGCC